MKPENQAVRARLDDPVSVRRLQWFLGGRLLVATVLLGATLYFAVDILNEGGFTPNLLRILISAIYASSILAGFSLFAYGQVRRIATTVVALDTLLITALVYLTGGAGSIFSILYGANILIAAITIGPTAAYAAAVASVTLFLTQAITVNAGLVQPPPDQPIHQYVLSTADLSYALLSNVVGVGVVAALASSLAGRLQTAGGRLLVAEQSAARLAQLNDDIVRSIASGVVTANEGSVISTINPAARDILRDRHNLLVGQPLSAVLPTLVERRLSQPPSREDGVGRRADGSTFPIGYTLSTLVDAEGRNTGMLLTFQDLTEIRELRNVAERAERLAVLGRLAAGLAHEIRNPLGAIAGSVELVRTNVVDDEDNHLLGIVSAEVDRLNELVTTMLQVGRPTQADRDHLDLRILVSDVVHVAKTDESLGTRTSIEASLPDAAVVANIDADRMRQVVWNLVKNAIQASPRGGTIVVQAGYAPTGAPCLEISDEGEGIPEDQRRHLFDMFYSGRQHGVGLGLALVKQIVNQHEATIEVMNRRPRGTSFRITFPPIEATSSSDPTTTATGSRPDSPPA